MLLGLLEGKFVNVARISDVSNFLQWFMKKTLYLEGKGFGTFDVVESKRY